MADPIPYKFYTGTSNGIPYVMYNPEITSSSPGNNSYFLSQFSPLNTTQDAVSYAQRMLDTQYQLANERVSRYQGTTAPKESLVPGTTGYNEAYKNYVNMGGYETEQYLNNLLSKYTTDPTYRISDADMAYLSKVSGAFTDATGKQILLGQSPSSGIVQGPVTAENTAGWYTQDAYNKMFGGADVVGSDAWHEAQVSAGLEMKVPIGSGFGYVPTGSAGA